MASNTVDTDMLYTLVLRDDYLCIEWLQSVKLIPPNPQCEICESNMRTTVRGPNSVIFECHKRVGNEHRNTRNALFGTIFEGSKFGIRNIVTLFYHFSLNRTSHEILSEACVFTNLSQKKDENNILKIIIPSPQTICDWLLYCRGVCFAWVDKLYREEKIGGPGVVVEVDKGEIRKMKNYREKPVKGMWILSLMEIKGEGSGRGGRFRMEICDDDKKDAVTLVPLILKHVLPGTIIHTDMWSSLYSFNNSGCVHFTVNHIKKVMSPTTGVHTQTVEPIWKTLKTSLRHIPSYSLASYLYEYVYRREVLIAGEDPFSHFLNAVATEYPGR